MRLIVVTGLPGTGKSAIGEALGRRLRIPVFAKDWLEAALLRAGWADTASAGRLGWAGYELLTTLVERQLCLGQSAIVDSVASTQSIRSQWRALATTYGARWLVIECVCSDELLHRNRLATRERQIPGWPEVGWAEVERVRSYYEPWQEDRLILDAAQPLDANAHRGLEYVRAG